MDILMQLRESTLSIRLSELINQLFILTHSVKDFDWTRKGINDYLLIRAARLFEVKIIQDRSTKKPKIKRKIMRSLKYKSVKRKRTLKEFIKQKFARSKNKKSRQQNSIHNFEKQRNKFARNVMRQ
jgi:hypothetical protein